MTQPTGISLHQLTVNWPNELQLLGSETRRVWVWLPDDYERTTADYPVLFMHDGQNVFLDRVATFGTSWQMIEAQRQLETPMIVVAVEGQNDGMRRFAEFSPWVNRELGVWKGMESATAGGEADRYLDFLCSNIVPEVHARFRCKTEADQNYLGGSSMGGFVSLYAATKYESQFGRYLAMSTATWFHHDALMDCLEQHRFQASTKIYADIGTEETSNEDLKEFPAIYLKGNEALFELLEKKLVKEKFKHFIDLGAIHNESAWARRLPSALLWLKS